MERALNAEEGAEVLDWKFSQEGLVVRVRVQVSEVNVPVSIGFEFRVSNRNLV